MITALKISQDFVHIRSAGQRDPISTHITWDVDYTVLYPILGADVEYTEEFTTREHAIERAIELLQGDLERNHGRGVAGHSRVGGLLPGE